MPGRVGILVQAIALLGARPALEHPGMRIKEYQFFGDRSVWAGRTTLIHNWIRWYEPLRPDGYEPSLAEF